MKDRTKALHHGYDKDNQRTMAAPIYQTTAYQFLNVDHAAESFNLKHGASNIYTRLGNPTTEIFERRFAELEGGASALAVSSGMAAISYAVMNLAGAGDNIVAASKLYGGTVTLFTHSLKRFGVSAKFFDVHKPEQLEGLIDSGTKAIFVETITNPSIDVPDFDRIVEIANRHGVVTVVDNTVATPFLCKPLSLGADVVVHSASKYTTGQGLAIGGVLVERARLSEKLSGNARYPQFNEPDASYHGLVYARDLAACPFTLRARLALLRDFGAALSPFNSWLFIQGLETLSIRIREHSASAQKVAEFLETLPVVRKVHYPGLKSNVNHPLAQKYLKNGCSGLLSFELDSFERAREAVDKTKLFSLVVNIGDSKSIITHPASTTHQQLSREELKAAGVPEGLVRLSVGLEDADDLIDDLRQALGQ